MAKEKGTEESKIFQKIRDLTTKDGVLNFHYQLNIYSKRISFTFDKEGYERKDATIRNEWITFVYIIKKVLNISLNKDDYGETDDYFFITCRHENMDELIESGELFIEEVSQNFADHKRKSQNMFRKEIRNSAVSNSLVIHETHTNIELFWKSQPFFYDKNKFFFLWDWDKNCWYDVDEVDLFNSVENVLNLANKTAKSFHKSEYIETMKRVGREKMPKEALVECVQFGDKIFDIKRQITYKSMPNYFFRNPIPHKIGKTSKTPIIDKLIVSWVGQEKLETVKEIIAYCAYNDYPIHKIFVFFGGGSNGKSTLLRLIKKFIGEENVTSTSIDSIIDNRFESYKLWGKKIAMMGETNYGKMAKTDMLKRLCGQDDVSFEAKNKNAFTGVNTAKLLISTNSLPSSDDDSDGFFRRWLIIDFPNQFEAGDDPLSLIPQEEYENLSRYVVEKLPILLKKCKFDKEGSIKASRQDYVLASNPLPFYIQNFCKEQHGEYINCAIFYTHYVKFLKENKRRIVKRKEMVDALTADGFDVRRTTHDQETAVYIHGITLKDNHDLISRKVTDFNSEGFSINEELYHYIKANPTNNKDGVINKFDPFMIMEYLEKGHLFELPKGQINVR